MKQSCENCRFLREYAQEYHCHRRAPRTINMFRYYQAELLRDLARSVRFLAQREYIKNTDIDTEATETACGPEWPEVDPEDWCGEWEGQRHDADTPPIAGMI